MNNLFIITLSLIILLIAIFVADHDETIISSVKLFLVISLVAFAIVIPIVTLAVMMK